MDLVLLRYNYGEFSTQGVLLIGAEFFMDTLECPWKNNAPFVSCIPEGEYVISYRESLGSRIRRAYEVKNVPDRTAILIHPGNTVKDFQGCIGVGARFGNQLYNSSSSFDNFKAVVGSLGTLKVTGVNNVL